MKNILMKLKRLFCQCAVISRFDSDVFIPPFRVGRKQMRAVLDAKGAEVVIFPKGLERYAKEYADFLNSIRQNGC